MKIWLKYLIGIVFGVAAAFIIPFGSVQSQAVLEYIFEIVCRFGRFALLPLLFFSVASSFFSLRDEKLLLRTTGWTVSVIVISSVLLTGIGLLSAIVIRLPRIPITVEQVETLPSIDVKLLFKSLFPYSGFESLLDGIYLLPCFVFAGLAGAGAASDKVASKPAVTLFDSLSNVCYIVMSFLIEVLSVGMIAISCKWTLDFIVVAKAGVYMPLVLMLFIILVVVAGLIYPLIIRLLCHDHHPYRVLYACAAPFITAFFSGDENLALSVNLRHGSESLGIRRRVNAFTYPLFSIFARGGAALVETICFTVILRSYSSLGISAVDAFWIAGMALLFSFCQCGLPTSGSFIAITLMCLQYGRGFEAGYLLLKTAAPIICSFAAGLNAITAMFGSYIVGVKTGMIQHKSLEKFI